MLDTNNLYPFSLFRTEHLRESEIIFVDICCFLIKMKEMIGFGTIEQHDYQ